jgi:hypothetical protein
MCKQVFQNEALTAFNNATMVIGNETVNNLKLVSDKVAATVFPLKAFYKQKQAMRAMRQYMQKQRT